MVVVQALVAAGTGVTTLPGLALQAHRRSDIYTTELNGSPRQLYTATYGDPPDPPASAALIQAIHDSVRIAEVIPVTLRRGIAFGAAVGAEPDTVDNDAGGVPDLTAAVIGDARAVDDPPWGEP
jgi:hypothetical protein